MSRQEDLQLVKNIQQGQKDDFAFLYDKYFQDIYNHIYYKTLNVDLTQDIVSDTFFKSFDKIQSFDAENGNFRAWLYTIARNVFFDDYKKKSADSLEPLLDVLPQEEKLTKDENNCYLYSAIINQLDILGEKKKDLVVMRLREGLSYKEITEITGRSESSLRKERSTTISQVKKACVGLLIVFLLAL